MSMISFTMAARVSRAQRSLAAGVFGYRYMKARNRKDFFERIPFYACAAFCCLLGISGLPAAASGLPARATAHFAIADFDGDNRPDLASINIGQSDTRSTRYSIAFRLSGGRRQTVGITAPAGGLEIIANDVNGDSFPDVIVSTAWTNKPVAILLNDGLGNFTVSSPSDFPNAFVTSEMFLSFVAPEIRDATGLLLLRSPSGNGGTSTVSLLPAPTSRRPVKHSNSVPLQASALAFVGRAPPLS